MKNRPQKTTFTYFEYKVLFDSLDFFAKTHRRIDSETIACIKAKLDCLDNNRALERASRLCLVDILDRLNRFYAENEKLM